MWNVRQLPELSEDFARQQRSFPSPFEAFEAGIVAVGVEPTIENLFEAYSFGIFPWPHEDYPLLWFCPDRRGVLEFKDFHIPDRLKRDLRRSQFTYSWNQNFRQVIESCKTIERPSEGGTWITDELVEAYVSFHQAGYAHSIEVWSENELAGGLYGVCVGGVFSAESMFFKKSPASKAALVHCVQSLQQLGHKWMDIQMVSSVSRQFGGKYISRKEFLQRLKSLNRSPHGAPL